MLLETYSGTFGENSNLNWNLNTSTGVLTISGSGEMSRNHQHTDIPLWDVSYQASITSIVIEDGVTEIGWFIFGNCVNLEYIEIPDSVTAINHFAFRECAKLASINLPQYLTFIGYIAFGGCSSLTSITIPGSVTYIGYEAFSSCYSLTTVIFYGTVEPTGYRDSFESSVTTVLVLEGYTKSTFCELTVTNTCNYYSGSCGINATYSLDTCTGVLTITGSGPMYDYTCPDGPPNTPWAEKGYSSFVKSAIITDELHILVIMPLRIVPYPQW
jgi:hypothetical protein